MDLWLVVLRAARPMPWKFVGKRGEFSLKTLGFGRGCVSFLKGEYDILDIHIDIDIHIHIERGCISVFILDIKQHISVFILDIKQHLYIHITYTFFFAGVSVREYFIFHQFQLPDVG